jgi:hypothetical protein
MLILFLGCYICSIYVTLLKFQRHMLPPSSGSSLKMGPVALVGIAAFGNILLIMGVVLRPVSDE